MKIPPLPDTDLANFATLKTSALRRRALEKFRISRPPHTYYPLRRFSPDILNISLGPLAGDDQARTSWADIEKEIISEAAAGSETTANLAVAKALYTFSERHQISGRAQEGFIPLPIGVSSSVNYWLKAVIQYEGCALVPFIDPRRSTRLTAEGRRFAFSVMHERIRVAFPDLAEVELGIFQFTANKNQNRETKLYTASSIELFSFAELDAMVRDTYAIWADVLAGRSEDKRRGTGTSGPLL